MLLNTLPIIGPSNRRIAITTMATITRINAYSTSPCPLSLDRNNIGASHPLPIKINGRASVCFVSSIDEVAPVGNRIKVPIIMTTKWGD